MTEPAPFAEKTVLQREQTQKGSATIRFTEPFLILLFNCRLFFD